MTTQKEFIESLLSKVKDIKDGIFIPNEIELKISDIENFNPIIANELSQIEELILTKKNYLNNEIQRKDEYKVKLLNYSVADNSISFYPSVLKNYLKKL